MITININNTDFIAGVFLGIFVILFIQLFFKWFSKELKRGE